MKSKKLYSLCIQSSGLIYFCYLTKILALTAQSNHNVKFKPHGFQLTQSTNIQRQEHLHNTCKLLGYNNSVALSELQDHETDHMLIDNMHNFLYCYVPKVACTNWKRVLMIMTNQWPNGSNPLSIPAHLVHSNGIFQKLSEIPKNQRKKILTEFTRFIIARHPFERLLSAYRNKLEGNSSSAKYFQQRIGRIIIKNFRKNPTKTALEMGHDVTFEEFVKYLLTPKLSMAYKVNQSFNEHWEPISKLCHPCALKYNIIGKYETLLDDSSLALSMSGAVNISFPTGYKSSGTSQYLRKYYEPISIEYLRKLYILYEEDFRLFDYGLEQILGYEFG